MSVRQRILKQMEKLDMGSVRKLSEICKLNHKTVNNYLNGKEKDNGEIHYSELSFHFMVSVCHYLFPDPVEVLNDYAREVRLNPNRKSALEYCSMNRQLDLGYELIENYQDVEALQDWLPTYTMIFNRETKKIDAEEITRMVWENKTNCPELKILNVILAAYAYNDLKKYDVCYELSHGVNQLFDGITIPYMKGTLNSRYTELYGYLSLRVFGDVKTSRAYCENLLNQSLIQAGYRGTAWWILGQSYLFEDPDRSVSCFEKAAAAFRESPRKGIAEKVENEYIPMVHILHDQFSKVRTTNVPLLAYLNARIGNTKKAIEYLDQYEKEGQINPFTIFIRGLATNDPELLIDSMARYDAKGEMFYINLPRFSAIGLGVPKYLVDGIIKYKMKSFEGVEEFEKVYYRHISSLDDHRIRRKHSFG